MIPSSTFSAEHVEGLWQDLLPVYGVMYDYHLAEGTVVLALTGILTEGIETEATLAGRYTRFWVDSVDLPRPPQAADWIDLGGQAYDVESVSMSIHSKAQLVLKKAGQSWLTSSKSR